MNLARAFVDSASRHRDKTAVFWGNEEISYDVLARSAGGVGAQLTEKGVQPGDRVALWLKNCPQFIPSYFGILLAGGVIVPINNFLKPDEVVFILRDAGVRVLIADESMTESVQKLQTLLPELQCLRAEQIPPAPVH